MTVRIHVSDRAVNNACADLLPIIIPQCDDGTGLAEVDITSAFNQAHNCMIVVFNGVKAGWEIDFPTEQDATMFLLRWSQ